MMKKLESTYENKLTVLKIMRKAKIEEIKLIICRSTDEFFVEFEKYCNVIF